MQHSSGTAVHKTPKSDQVTSRFPAGVRWRCWWISIWQIVLGVARGVVGHNFGIITAGGPFLFGAHLCRCLCLFATARSHIRMKARSTGYAQLSCKITRRDMPISLHIVVFKFDDCRKKQTKFLMIRMLGKSACLSDCCRADLAHSMLQDVARDVSQSLI